MRLDAALIARGMVPSRARAKEQIQDGRVTVNGVVCTKASREVTEDDVLAGAEVSRYVGRGGFKLERALREFQVPVNGRVCLDIGASTGGFTDCMLQNNAQKVYALDVGHDQLAQALREDPRVVNLEGTNIRAVTPQSLQTTAQLITIDVSFISLSLVLPAASGLLDEGGDLIALIKPQFEAGKSALDKHGVVKSAKAHEEVLRRVCAFAAASELGVCGCCPSPVRGGSGNREYLIHLKKHQQSVPLAYETIVAAAFCGK